MSTDNKTILIIEDDNFLSQILVENFQSEGFTTYVAKNGKEGYDKAIELKPEVILLDVILPKMDGMEVLKKLRKDDWGKTASVIVLSNLFRAEVEKNTIRHQVDAHLLKTEWNPGQVVEKVKKILKK